MLGRVSDPGMEFYPHQVALALCTSPSQSAIRQWRWDSTPCGAVSTREIVLNAPAVSEL